MKSKTLFTKVIAMLLCAMMVVGCLPLAALADTYESAIDKKNGVGTPDLPVCDHENTTTTTVDATCQDAGSITVTCNDCKQVISTTPIEQLVHTAGTCENCAIILEVPGPSALTVGTLYYAAYNVNGMNVTFTGATSVIYNEETFTAEDEYSSIIIEGLVAARGVPAVFVVEVAEDASEPSAEFSFPKGHPQNPDTLSMGSNTATVAANDKNGYNFEWIATHTGEVTITMPADSGWAYQWTNQTTGVTGDTIFSDTADAVHTYAVTAGDEITLMVNSYDPESWNTPAATIEFTANYPAGSDANPYALEVPGPTTLIEGTNYYSTMDCNNMIITINGATSVVYNDETYNAVEGVITIDGLVAGRGMPAVFLITVEEGAEATATFNYPVGHPQNAATLVIGENTATVEANSWDGYNYVWTATETGNVIITMPDDSGWAYAWNNQTSGIYGDTIFSDTADAVHTYAVTEGDEITMMVNSYDPNSWDTPAASITFSVNYEVVGPAYDANLKIMQTAFSAESYIGAQIILETTGASVYDSVYMKVEHAGSTYELYENIGAAWNMFGFEYRLEAKQMTDKVIFTPYGVKNDVEYAGVSLEWSAKEAASAMLDSTNKANNTEQQKKIAKVLANMLNYGAEAQKAFGYNIAELATDGLSTSHLSLIETSEPEIANTSKVTNNGINGVTLVTKALGLESIVQIQAIINLNSVNINDCEARVVYNGSTYTIDGKDFMIGGGTIYGVIFEDLEAKDVRVGVEITLYNKNTDTAISETYTESVESIGYTMLSTKFATLIKALMHYGDACNNLLG